MLQNNVAILCIQPSTVRYKTGLVLLIGKHISPKLCFVSFILIQHLCVIVQIQSAKNYIKLWQIMGTALTSLASMLLAGHAPAL